MERFLTPENIIMSRIVEKGPEDTCTVCAAKFFPYSPHTLKECLKNIVDLNVSLQKDIKELFKQVKELREK